MEPKDYAIYNRDELQCQHPVSQIKIADDNTGAFCQNCRDWISVTAVATSARIAELETTNSKLRAGVVIALQHFAKITDLDDETVVQGMNEIPDIVNQIENLTNLTIG